MSIWSKWRYACWVVLLLLVAEGDLCARNNPKEDIAKQSVDAYNHTDDNSPIKQELHDRIYDNLVACRVVSHSYADTPIRVRRSISENRTINPYVTLLNGTKVVGIGVEHLLNQKVLTSSRLLIGLASVEIVFPFHSFW